MSCKNDRVRIVDIAEELGLSTATVSYVIHGKTKKISDETVKRVQELLEKRQYIPSMAGILLAQNDSRIIGIVVNDHEKYEGHVLEDGFISSALHALSAEIDHAGYFMMVKATREWKEIAKFASMWNMAGIVLIGFCEQDYRKMRESMHIPFVVYDGFLKETGKMVNIVADHFDGGYQMGKYLLARGHRRILCISDNHICMDALRWEGLKTAVPEAEFMEIPMQRVEREQFYRDHLEKILQFTAVFAVSDYYAVDLMYFLIGQGISVPEEISVAGFDDSSLSRQVQPALTTIRQDNGKRAKMALKLLEELREEREEGRTCVLPVEIVERESVKKIG